jgi:hypothetical protein
MRSKINIISILLLLSINVSAQTIVPIKPQKVIASSQYPADNSSYYPEYAADGNKSTAWFPKRTTKSNLGEWIEFDFQKTVRLSRISIYNGWLKDSQRWRYNSRIKNLKISFSRGEELNLILQDNQIKQDYPLNNVVTDWVRLTIIDCYSGTVIEAGITDVLFEGAISNVNSSGITEAYKDAFNTRPSVFRTKLAFDELLSGTWQLESGSIHLAEYPYFKVNKLSEQAASAGFILMEPIIKDFEWDGAHFYCLSKLKANKKEDWVRTKITPNFKSLTVEYLEKSKVFYNWKPNTISESLINKGNRILTNKIKQYVEGRINDWQVKGEFEKTSDYLVRVNEKTKKKKIEEFQNEAIDFYKTLYSVRILPSDFTLATYDADNESFLIKSPVLGEFVLPVSMAEAPVVKQQFAEMRFSNIDFGIKDDNFVLSHIEFRYASANKVYTYDSKNKVIYNTTKINYKFDDINVELKNEPVATNNNVRKSTTTISVGKSDVDTDIPNISIKESQNRFALIIGNEDYKSYQPDLNSEVNVLFAENDARTFKEYAVKTLGVKEENITLLINATAARMNQAIAKMNLIAKNSNGKAELIFYYAGHGLPEENSKEPYLIPVDVSGANFTEGGIKLSTVYEKLTQYPSLKVTVFIDACFTGGARNQEMLSARGIKMKPKEISLTGNIVVFSASSGEQSSLPYKDKQHGMFTYFLLKKIQDTKGEISMKELSDYVRDQVSLQSVNINNKEQTPMVDSGIETWGNWKLR